MSHFALWLGAAGLTIAAGVFVPYGLLGGGAPSFDIFGFWCLFGAAVLALVLAGVARWKD